MKKLHLLLICFSLCMISCKKENVTLLENEDNSKVSYLKTWYETHTNNDTRQFSRDEFTLYPQTILWETGTFLPESNRYVFSLNEYQDAEIIIPKLIIFYLSEDGEVTNSEYVFIRANENTTGMTLPEIMAAYVDVFEDENIPETLELSMLKFNMDGERVFSKHIENGEITDTDEQIKSVEKAPLEAGLEYCIDSWWVMYLEGQVIYIYHLGSECFCVGCNQNGGGGGSGGGSPNPEQLLANFEGQGTAISGPEHSQILSSSANAENVVYTWQIYQAFTYGLVSYEDAEINKVLSPSGSVIKSFHNMTHRKIASVGISVGGTRTFEDLGASFNISQFRVDERIDFTVTHSAAGLTCNS